jgi:hypothetical protein
LQKTPIFAIKMPIFAKLPIFAKRLIFSKNASAKTLIFAKGQVF